METKQDFLNSLSDEQKKAFLKLEKKQKSKAKPSLSYVEKNLEMFEKFFAGELTLTDFKRDSRSKKVASQLRYYFERKAKTNIKGDVTKEAKTCFQFKTFVSDLLMAKAILEGEFDADGKPIGQQQRFAVMRYELVKHLQASSKKPRVRGGKGIEVVVPRKGKEKKFDESMKQKEVAESNLEKVSEKVVVPQEEIIQEEPPKRLPGVETAEQNRAKGL